MRMLHSTACCTSSIRRIDSEGSEDGLGAGDGDLRGVLLDLRRARRVSWGRLRAEGGGTYAEVGDLEVVEDERVARGALAEADAGAAEVGGETELLGPGGVDVGEGHDLRAGQRRQRERARADVRTLSATPWTRVQPLRTKGSLFEST